MYLFYTLGNSSQVYSVHVEERIPFVELVVAHIAVNVVVHAGRGNDVGDLLGFHRRGGFLVVVDIDLGRDFEDVFVWPGGFPLGLHVAHGQVHQDVVKGRVRQEEVLDEFERVGDEQVLVHPRGLTSLARNKVVVEVEFQIQCLDVVRLSYPQRTNAGVGMAAHVRRFHDIKVSTVLSNADALTGGWGENGVKVLAIGHYQIGTIEGAFRAGLSLHDNHAAVIGLLPIVSLAAAMCCLHFHAMVVGAGQLVEVSVESIDAGAAIGPFIHSEATLHLKAFVCCLFVKIDPSVGLSRHSRVGRGWRRGGSK